MAPKQRRWQLISFDLDGTLVDTAAEIAEAANRVLEAHGLARRSPAQITLFVGAGTHELIRRLHALCEQDEPGLAERVPVSSLLSAMDRHYQDTTGTVAQPYAGCRDMLDRLKQAGLRLACVTNKELRHARRVLEVTALDGCFELVIGGD
ncbi:MAG TPA: HAD hydrolase-like protein, partial [Methylibium sp.]|uniref:HAD hydrolase-like protein n=1 Tax=Methylibium sp. TaxID=2067992 RepID=UPI002DBBABB1